MAAPEDTPRGAANWAPYVNRLTVGSPSARAVNLNVAGRRVTSPIQGFGKLWEKTYRADLTGADVEPSEVVKTWRAHFGDFWPRRNFFYGSLDGIKPGDVALLNLSLLGVPLVTGVLVLYADDESFTVMTPQGHQFAGFNTFRAYRRDGVTTLEIKALVRGSDPLYEVMLAVGGHAVEDWFWVTTLRNLAKHYGVSADVSKSRVCLDRRRQWKQAGNLWHNAGVRSLLYLLATPVRAGVAAVRRSRNGGQ